MSRTLIISAHCGNDRLEHTDPAVLKLMNRFEDDLKGWEKMFLAEEGSLYGDLWFAEWDADTDTLSTSVGPSEAEVSVKGWVGCDPVKDLLPALYLIMDRYMDV